MSWCPDFEFRGHRADAFLAELVGSLAAYDGYLWSTRNDSSCAGLLSGAINLSSCPASPSAGSPGNSRGLLWSTGSGIGFGKHGSDGDSGEDGTDKYINNTGPIQKMDMMGYSYDLRRGKKIRNPNALRHFTVVLLISLSACAEFAGLSALSRIATLRGQDAEAQRWQAAAATVANKTIENLWRPEHSAMFDRDATDAWVTTLVHNNLRMMWFGLFTQPMADAFLTRHLMNASEFWTKMPLPSIAVSDPRFHCDPTHGNDWSGPTEGLTTQRAIRALESYGHFAELTLVGRALTAALLSGCQQHVKGKPAGCHFPQQIDPFTALPWTTGLDDGYGPMIISLLQYTALRVGIVPRAQVLQRGSAATAATAEGAGAADEGGGLLWSGIADDAAASRYNQTLGEGRLFSLVSDSLTFSGSLNGKLLFTCSAGVRVVSDPSGAVVAVVGIDDVRHNNVQLTLSGLADEAAMVIELPSVRPNEVWIVKSGAAALGSSAPFVAPHSQPAAKTDDSQPWVPPTPRQSNPTWKPTYNMSMSTVIFPCNHSGFFNPQQAAKYGLVSIDFENTME